MLSLPIAVITAILIKFESDGPVIYKQERVGENGRTFNLYKFRSMRADAEKHTGPVWAGENDPRITRIGRFIRKVRIDEIPQMINVLKGDMSIVGPRPLYLSQIPEWNEEQKKRLLVKPGLTGLAQIQGRGELTREKKLALDVKYVKNKGLLTDIKIILATIVQMFGRKGIYEKRYSRTEYTRQEARHRTRFPNTK